MAEPTRDSHVAILAFPFGSHAAAILAVTCRLASAAPSTVFSFFNTAQSNSSLSSFSDLPANIRFHNIADGVPEGYVLSGIPLEAIELFLEAAHEIFRREILAAETEVGRKVTCMVTDAFLGCFAADMATEMKSSWVAFWTAGANSLTVHLYTDLIRETFDTINDCKEETLGFISGMEKFRVKDTPEGVLFGDLDSVFSKTLYQMGLALPRATAVFIASFKELDPPTLTDNLRSKLGSYLNIAPLVKTETQVHDDPYGCLTWMEKQLPSSVVYISFGRIMAPPPGELAAIAEGLDSRKVPFIWSLKEKDKAHLPKGFLERTKEQGMVVPWAPQVELLKHQAMGVFVNHGGWNSVLESVTAGIPMICRPILGDHGLNARSVEAVWEIGTTVSNGIFTKDGFEKCLDRVLVENDGKKMKESAKKLKEQAQKSISEKGSSFEDFKVLLDEIVRV